MTKFTKPPEQQADFDDLGTPADPEFLERLRVATLETIVTARRVFESDPMRDLIDEILVARADPVLRARARRRAFTAGIGNPDNVHAQEMEDELVFAFWEKILTGETFFEIRFDRTLRFLLNDVFEKVVTGKQRTHERNAARIVSDDDAQAEEPRTDHARESEIASEDDVIDQVEVRLILESVLGDMPREVATAMTLRYIFDYPVHSNAAGKRSVSQALGCSERKARQLVADGRSILRSIYGQEMPDE